jgi:hypothetical protein
MTEFPYGLSVGWSLSVRPRVHVLSAPIPFDWLDSSPFCFFSASCLTLSTGQNIQELISRVWNNKDMCWLGQSLRWQLA